MTCCVRCRGLGEFLGAACSAPPVPQHCASQCCSLVLQLVPPFPQFEGKHSVPENAKDREANLSPWMPCSVPDVHEPAAVRTRGAVFALQRDLYGLRAAFLEVMSAGVGPAPPCPSLFLPVPECVPSCPAMSLALSVQKAQSSECCWGVWKGPTALPGRALSGDRLPSPFLHCSYSQKFPFSFTFMDAISCCYESILLVPGPCWNTGIQDPGLASALVLSKLDRNAGQQRMLLQTSCWFTAIAASSAPGSRAVLPGRPSG